MPTTTNIDINVIQNLQQAASTSFWAAVISGAAAIAAAIIAIVGLVIQAKLNNKLKEQEIRFSKLHERRAEVIEEVYTKIVKLEIALENYIHGITDNPQTAKEKAKKALRKFKNFYDKKKIFFKKEIIELLEETFKEAGLAINNKDSSSQIYPTSSDQAKDEIIQNLSSARYSVFKTIPGLKQELDKEFRELLGVK